MKRNNVNALSPIIGIVFMLIVGVLFIFVFSSFGSGEYTGNGPQGEVVFSGVGPGDVEGVVSDSSGIDSLIISVNTDDGSDIENLEISDVEDGIFYYCGGEEGDTIIVTGEFKGLEQIIQRYDVKSGAGGAGSLSRNQC